MKYIQFDDAGHIVARFDDNPDYEPHPTGTVEVDDALWERTFMEIDGVWMRDTNTGEIKKAPFPAFAFPPQTRFTVREFVKRFTLDEQISIRRASLEDMEVGLIYDDFNRADFVDIEDPDVASALEVYVLKGLIDEARKVRLLSPGIQDPNTDFDE